MPRYVLQVVVETEEDHTKKAVREALTRELETAEEDDALGYGLGIVKVKRIYVRREVDKQ